MTETHSATVSKVIVPHSATVSKVIVPHSAIVSKVTEIHLATFSITNAVCNFNKVSVSQSAADINLI